MAKWFIAVSLALVVSGCYYSFTENPYPDIKSLRVVPIDNTTTEYDIADPMTESLLDKINSSGLFEVKGGAADATLSGTITSFDREVHTYTSEEEPEEYIITIKVRASFVRLSDGKKLWQSTFQGWGTYPADGDDENAIRDAVNMAAQHILDKLRGG